MQPTTRVAAASNQETRFAIPAGGAKTMLVWINVYENSSGAAATVTIYGASDLNLNDNLTSNSFWRNLGTIAIGAGASGAFSATISNPPPYLRWGISGLNNNIAFEIIAEMWDT